MRSLLLAGTALLLAITGAGAADITIDVPKTGDPVIHITGQIFVGDEQELATLIPRGRHRADVSLSSPGGVIETANAMGQIIWTGQRRSPNSIAPQHVVFCGSQP